MVLNTIPQNKPQTVYRSDCKHDAMKFWRKQTHATCSLRIYDINCSNFFWVSAPRKMKKKNKPNVREQDLVNLKSMYTARELLNPRKRQYSEMTKNICKQLHPQAIHLKQMAPLKFKNTNNPKTKGVRTDMDISSKKAHRLTLFVRWL